MSDPPASTRPVDPALLLDAAYERAVQADAPIISERHSVERIDYVCRNPQNRVGIRLLLACMLAKAARPEVDVRKPFTEIGGADSFSGRSYDEMYIAPFVNKYKLPCNSTTAFLSPALRTKPVVLSRDAQLGGRPRKLYQTLLQIFDAVYRGSLSAEDVLAEIIRLLILIRDEQQQRVATLLATLRSAHERLPLSSEMIVSLIEQHLKLPRTSRLPVLIVAAAYQVAASHLGEHILPLTAHNAADEQTGALGDVQISLIDENSVVTSYEMKSRRVTLEDIDRATQKISHLAQQIDNYIFITIAPLIPSCRTMPSSGMSTTAAQSLLFSTVSGFCGISCTCFIGCARCFLMHTRLYFSRSQRAQ